MAEDGRDAYVVRILGPDSVPVGAGVLVGARQIITCAHVVNEALGRRWDSQERPEGRVRIDFLAGAGTADPIEAAPERWSPPLDGALADGDDFAGLVIVPGSLPPGLRPVSLSAEPAPPGRRVAVFGCPDGLLGRAVG